MIFFLPIILLGIEKRPRRRFILPESLVLAGLESQVSRVAAAGGILYSGSCEDEKTVAVHPSIRGIVARPMAVPGYCEVINHPYCRLSNDTLIRY